MTSPEKHFNDTKKLIKKISLDRVAEWLLVEGYFPEQYVLPPTFKINKFDLKSVSYYKIKVTPSKTEFKPKAFETVHISFPKSQLTERIFGIIEPTIYHDIVKNLVDEWDLVIKHIFHKDIKIFSYSFPIPVSKRYEGEVGALRSGRMIYEFIEMAENDSVAEGHEFKYLLKTDIKNFYPTIYTHSIAWALHGKNMARSDRQSFNLLGTKLDKLFQNANDCCTNGLPIGPAVSDLISEIILARVDRDCSNDLKNRGINYLGTRFKDDYRFLCNSKTDAETIIKSLQVHLRQFNLNLNESKSEIKSIPEGFYRRWCLEYQKISLKNKKQISYKLFENTLLNVIQIDKENPDTGVIDKFLSEITTKRYTLKVKANAKQSLKMFSLLLMLKERRAKAFPQILAIIEQLIILNKNKKRLLKKISSSVQILIDQKMKNPEENQYDLLWLIYFIQSNKLCKITWNSDITSTLIKSLKRDKQIFFSTGNGIKLYTTLTNAKKSPLLKHLAIFPRK
jgi:hypothetical protein